MTYTKEHGGKTKAQCTKGSQNMHEITYLKFLIYLQQRMDYFLRIHTDDEERNKRPITEKSPNCGKKKRDHFDHGCFTKLLIPTKNVLWEKSIN